MANFGLPDAVDTAEPLFGATRPRGLWPPTLVDLEPAIRRTAFRGPLGGVQRRHGARRPPGTQPARGRTPGATNKHLRSIWLGQAGSVMARAFRRAAELLDPAAVS